MFQSYLLISNFIHLNNRVERKEEHTNLTRFVGRLFGSDFPNISESLSTIALTSNFRFGSHYDINSIASLSYDDAKMIVISVVGSEPGFFFLLFHILFCYFTRNLLKT